jgi:hypothetical protein
MKISRMSCAPLPFENQVFVIKVFVTLADAVTRVTIQLACRLAGRGHAPSDEKLPEGLEGAPATS